MIAVDTNILVYAHRPDSVHHEAARSTLESLTRSGRRWGVPWPCVHEFLAVVTHPRIYVPPTPQPVATQAVADLLSLQGVITLAESREHLVWLDRFASRTGVVGGRVHEARIASICLGHGVTEVLTADRDFGLFPELATRNPLVR